MWRLALSLVIASLWTYSLTRWLITEDPVIRSRRGLVSTAQDPKGRERRGKGAVMFNKSVPIITVSLNVDRKNYLSRLIRSIDYPVDRLIIQIGNADPKVINKVITAIQNASVHARVGPKIEVSTISSNPGSANGFNLGLRALLSDDFPAEWALVVNSDISFYPGILQRIARNTERQLVRNKKFGIGFTSLCCGSEWSAVVFTRRLVKAIGIMDENFYPAYYEDDDYAIRVNHGGFHAVRYNNTPLLHGEIDGSKDYLSGVFANLYLNPAKDAATRSWRKMHETGQTYAIKYIERKWGISVSDKKVKFDCKSFAGINGECKTGFRVPFNDSRNDLSYWKLDESAREAILRSAG